MVSKKSLKCCLRMDTGALFRLLLVLSLVAANAFFVVSEFALVRVRPTRLRELSHRKISAANVALRLVGSMDRVLSSVQLGVTMASLGLGWAGEATVATIMIPWLVPILSFSDSAVALAHTIALTIAFFLVTVMHIIFGELVPKGLALARTDRMAVIVARPMEVFVALTHPFTHVINIVAGRVLRVLGGGSVQHGQVHSAEELKM